MIKRFLYSIIFLIPISVHSSNPPEKEFYNYFISGNMNDWEKSLKKLQAIYVVTGNYETLHNIVKAQYGLVAWYIGNDKKSKAHDEIDLAEEYLKKLIQKHPENSIYKAWRGAFIGYRLGVSPWKAVYLGPQSQEFINKAIEEHPQSPEANFEYANMKFWSPAIVGGNKKEALTYYKKTVQLLEKENQINDWYYLWTLTAWANAHKKLGNQTAAQMIYKKILQIEPDYEWVANELSKSEKALPDLNL